MTNEERMELVQARIGKVCESVRHIKKEWILLAVLEAAMQIEFKQMEAEGLICRGQIDTHTSPYQISVGLPSEETQKTATVKITFA